jgi:hypothetical protein
VHANFDEEQMHENSDEEQVHESFDEEQVHENVQMTRRTIQASCCAVAIKTRSQIT